MSALKSTRVHRFPARLGWALIWWALSACQAPERLPPIPEAGVILAFGDSLTYGTGVTQEASYPAVLAALTGRTVINAGVPGETTAEGVERLPDLLAAHQPDLLILMEGGNDMLRRQPDTQTRANLRRMVTAARERGVAVILVGVPKPGLVLKSAAFYPELAEVLQVPYVDGVVAEILADHRLKSDLIHPNGRGYQRLAEALADFLRERGAL